MTDDSAKPIKTADSDRPKPIGIDPAAYDGDIVSRLRHWRGLHLAHNGELFEAAADEIERLRTIMRRVVDEDCTIAVQGGAILADDEVVCRVARAAHEMAGTATACTAEADTTQPRNGAVCTPQPQPTPGEGSKPSEGTSEPVAWWVKGCEYDTGCEYEFVALLKEQAELAATQGGNAVPLYRSPTLTDAEREAVEWCVEMALLHATDCEEEVATLHGLLERLK